MSLIKARLLDTALTSYQNFSNERDPPENLRPDFKAFKQLSKKTKTFLLVRKLTNDLIEHLGLSCSVFLNWPNSQNTIKLAYLTYLRT